MTRPLLLLWLAACSSSSGDGADKRGDKQKPDPVTVVQVAPAVLGAVSRSLTTSAVIESERAADVTPQTSGVVLSVRKGDGDAVARGELLAVLQNASLEAGAERANAEVARLTTEVAQLEALQARGAISNRELEDARYRLQTARTSATEARSAEGLTRLTAPFDGLVARRDVRVGELAPAGKAAFAIVDPHNLHVIASLPERDLSAVSLGQQAVLTSAYDDALSATASVSRLAPVVDASTGTFRVTLDVDPGQATLRPGQFVSVAITVDTHRDVLVVDRAAVVWEDGGAVLYRMIPAPPTKEDEEQGADGKEDGTNGWFASLFAAKGDGAAKADGGTDSDSEPDLEKYVAERVSVTLGLLDAEHAEVLSGVAAGDAIITVGQSGLRDGAAVRTPELQAKAREREKAKRDKDKADAKADGATE